MLFNANKFDYLSFACRNNFLSSNAYVNPDFNIINQHDHIKDLGILMSGVMLNFFSGWPIGPAKIYFGWPAVSFTCPRYYYRFW